MATTHFPNSASETQRRNERNSYAAVWMIIALAVLAAIAYGYYFGEQQSQDMSTMAESTLSPTDEGSMLTPSVVSPGAPDTTTTESSTTPAQGIE